MQPLIILFDGVCNLCNGFVQFVIKRDPKERFKFAALQSNAAKELLLAKGLNPNQLQTVVFIEGEKVYTQAAAALRITKYLSAAWPLFSVFSIVPNFISNGIYQFIAKNRYRWFGKKNQCMVPSPSLKARFL